MCVIDAHLEWCALRNLAMSTIRTKREILDQLSRFMDGPIEHATKDQLSAYWTGRKIAPTTRATELAHLRSFYGWLIDAGYRVDDPTRSLPKPRLPRALPRPVAEAEMVEMIAIAPHPICDWLLLAAYAGLRACEIAGLRGEDYTPDGLLIRNGKGGKGRIVPVHPKVEAAAFGWATFGPLWSTPSGVAADARFVCQTTSRWLRSQGARSSLHCYRHRFASQAYRACRDLRAVQELCGHASPATTQRYVQVAEGVARAAVVALT